MAFRINGTVWSPIHGKTALWCTVAGLRKALPEQPAAGQELLTASTRQLSQCFSLEIGHPGQSLRHIPVDLVAQPDTGPIRVGVVGWSSHCPLSRIQNGREVGLAAPARTQCVPAPPDNHPRNWAREFHRS